MKLLLVAFVMLSNVAFADNCYDSFQRGSTYFDYAKEHSSKGVKLYNSVSYKCDVVDDVLEYLDDALTAYTNASIHFTAAAFSCTGINSQNASKNLGVIADNKAIVKKNKAIVKAEKDLCEYDLPGEEIQFLAE